MIPPTTNDVRKGECEGRREKCSLKENCPKFGTLGRPARDGKRRIAGCGDPVARGKRNRSKGDSKARSARKRLQIGGANTRHEELWGGAVRVEMKAGAQIEPIATRFNAAKQQSDASRAYGDTRLFAMVAMPDGTNKGIVLMDLDDFAQFLSLVIESDL